MHLRSGKLQQQFDALNGTFLPSSIQVGSRILLCFSDGLVNYELYFFLPLKEVVSHSTRKTIQIIILIIIPDSPEHYRSRHAFEPCNKAGLPRENPHNSENMQTPHRDLNQDLQYLRQECCISAFTEISSVCSVKICNICSTL